MGSIRHCYNKDKWVILKNGKIKKNNKEVYEICIGYIDDYLSSGDIKIWILKDVYEKIMNGEYNVLKHPYREPYITITDSKENKIPLLDLS